MTQPTLEERVAALEEELNRLKQRLESEKPANGPRLPWWEERFGAFADSPEYDEAMRAGREYRESLRPKDAEEEAA